MRGKTDRIDILIRQLFKNKAIVNGIRKTEIMSIINRTLSENEISNIYFKGIKIWEVVYKLDKNNKLILSVDSSVLLYELEYFKKGIILKDLKKHKIDDIRFTLEKNNNGR